MDAMVAEDSVAATGLAGKYTGLYVHPVLCVIVMTPLRSVQNDT